MCHLWQNHANHVAQSCDLSRDGTGGERLLRGIGLADSFKIICSGKPCWALGSGVSRENAFVLKTVRCIFYPLPSHLGFTFQACKDNSHPMVAGGARPFFSSSETIWAGSEWEEERQHTFQEEKNILKSQTWGRFLEQREVFRGKAVRCSVKACVIV